MSETKESSNVKPPIFNSLLKGNSQGLKDALGEESSEEKRYGLIIGLFGDVRKWRLSPSFDPLQMKKVRETLKDVFLVNTEGLPQEFRDYPRPIEDFLTTEVTPFDSDYQKRKDHLLINSNDPYIRTFVEKITDSSRITHDNVSSDVEVKANGDVFQFEISVCSDRDEPRKDVYIEAKRQGKKVVELISSIDYSKGDDEEENAFHYRGPYFSINYHGRQDATYQGATFIVDPEVKEEYDGVEQITFALAMAVAVTEGARQLIVLDVPKGDKTYDLLFPPNSPCQLTKEENGPTNHYRLILNTLDQIPETGIKKK